MNTWRIRAEVLLIFFITASSSFSNHVCSMANLWQIVIEEWINKWIHVGVFQTLGSWEGKKLTLHWIELQCPSKWCEEKLKQTKNKNKKLFVFLRSRVWVCGWKIIKRKHQGILAKPTWQRSLKASKNDQILSVQDEEFNQIQKVIRYPLLWVGILLNWSSRDFGSFFISTKANEDQGASSVGWGAWSREGICV